MLKAKISQTKSNLYAVKTTKYDTTDIELTVETTDSSPWLNPKFELLGIKSDGHEVRQTENFKVIDLNNHIVQVTLDEQLVTCEGNVDLQLLIKDGSRKSSTPFKLHVGRSLDSDILESHRNVKVLDELEKYIIEGREYISEATGLAQSTANYVQAVNTQAEANEAQRLQNESQRQSDETKRKEAEDDRKQAEVLRVQNEDTRQSAEVIRVANEQTRLENESNRIERETDRENKESIRQAQEQKRHNAESTRQSQEATRQSNEDNRKQAEKSRNQEETIRINNEATRKQVEDARQSQELDRQSAESARSTAETNRNNAESTRTQNENTRKSQETTRQQKETERQSAETARQQNETSRQTAETKRAEAENARKAAETTRANDMQAFKDEANRLATELNTQSSRLDQLTEDTENQINEFVETNQTAVDSFLETADSRLVNDKDKIDYWGNHHQSLKDKSDYEVDKLLGDFNSINYQGEYITAQDTISRHIKNAVMKGHTEVNCIQEPSGADIVLPYDFEPGYDVTISDTKETGAVGIELQGQTLNYMLPYKSFECSNPQGYNEVESNLVRTVYDDHVHYSLTLNPNSGRTLSFNHAPNKVATFYAGKTYTLYIPSLPQPMAVATRLLVRDNNHAHNYAPVKQNKDYFVFTALEDFSYLGLYQYFDFDSSMLGKTVECNVSRHAIVIEGDYYNQPLPLLEQGLNNVKAPTVTATEKNLFDGNLINGYYEDGTLNKIIGDNANLYKTIKLNLKKGTYTFSFEESVRFIRQLKDGVYNTFGGDFTEFTTTLNTDGIYVLSFRKTDNTDFNLTQIQVEEGSVATSYEPFKSSSLTLPEEIVLRSLPNGVRDTYNVQTGEYVQRIGETPLNSTLQYWEQHGNSNEEYFVGIVWRTIPDAKSGTAVICNRLKHRQTTREDSCIYFSAKYPIITFSRDSLDTFSIQGFKNKIDSMDLEIQYELAEPIITKVSLSQVLKSWNTLTHINTSIPENSLKPIIAPVNPSYKVMLKPSTQYSIITNPIANGHASTPIEFNLGGATAETVVGNGCTLITTPSTLANNKLEMSGRGQKLQGGVMVLEGNKTGMMFSHFDGMKSVENPTVRVNNKNLFISSKHDALIDCGDHYAMNKVQATAKPVRYQLKPNTTYVFSFDKYGTDPCWVGVIINGQYSNNSNTTFKYTFTTGLDGIADIVIGAKGNNDLGHTITNVQLEESRTRTGAISHQSNSLPLTIPMRSLPDGTCDTLNLLTGEHVQNIGKLIISDNVKYSSVDSNNHVMFTMPSSASELHTPNRQQTGVYCDRFIVRDIYGVERDFEGIELGTTNPRSVFIKISKSKLQGYQDSLTADQKTELFKDWLRGNPITLQYQLEEPIVTHLDLQWEDGKLFAYDGTTHFFVDVEGGQLMPILDIDVPTNLSAATSRINREKNQLAQDNQELQTTLELAKLKEAQLEKELAEAKEQVANEVTTLNKRDDLLEESQAVQDNDIVTSMLASAELFEMVLLMMPMSASMSKSMGVNPMVEVYVTLILKGEKTIEQVPAVIRDKVQAQLDLLTK